MTDSKKAAPAIKPLVAMIALANAQMAFGCADVVVNAASALDDIETTTTFDEALVHPDLCGSIVIDESLAGQTLDWASNSLLLSSTALTIAGPSIGAATVAVSPTIRASLVASTLTITDLKFVPGLDSLRETTLIQIDFNSSLDIDSAEFVGFDASASGGVIHSTGTLKIVDSVFEANSSTTVGGAISASTGQATITDSEFRDNVAGTAGGAISGNTVALTIEDSVFESNDAQGGAGGAISQVGESNGTLTVARSEFRGNKSTTSGGAIYQSSSIALDIEDSVFEQNHASQDGGAVYVSDFSLGSPVTLRRSTISNNRAGGSGGGVHARIPEQGLEVENSTIHGNSAQTTAGGIFVISNSSAPAISISHSTLTDNQSAGTDVFSAGALNADNAASIDISHTVIAGNTQGGEGTGNICVGESSPGVQAILEYSFWDNTTNYDASCGLPLTDTSTNILNEADAGLSELADNGGLTKTRFPLANSPLLEAGDPNILDEPETDQRGSARILDGVIDIGAVEYGNKSPIASVIDVLEVTQGVPFSADASNAFSDPDDHQLSYAISGQPAGASIDATSGVISGTAQAAGDYTVTVTASDTYGASANTTFALKVAEGSSGGGGGSFGYVLGVLAPLAIWRRLRRKA